MRPLVLILLCALALTVDLNSVQSANIPSDGENSQCSPKYMNTPVKKSKSNDDYENYDYSSEESGTSGNSGLCPSTCSKDADCVSMEKTDVCLCKNQVNGEGEVEIEVPATTFCTPDDNRNSKCAKMCSQSQVQPPFNNPYNCVAKLDDDESTTIEYCTCAGQNAHAVSCNDSIYTETLNDDDLDITPKLCAATCPSGSSCLATRSSDELKGNCLCDEKPGGGTLGLIEVSEEEEYDYNYDENYDYENGGSGSPAKVEKYYGKIACKHEEDGKTCPDCKALDSIRTNPFKCNILGYKTASYKDKDAKVLQTFCTCAKPGGKSLPKTTTTTTQKPKQTKPPKGEKDKEKPGNNKNNKGKDKSKPKPETTSDSQSKPGKENKGKKN